MSIINNSSTNNLASYQLESHSILKNSQGEEISRKLYRLDNSNCLTIDRKMSRKLYDLGNSNYLTIDRKLEHPKINNFNDSRSVSLHSQLLASIKPTSSQSLPSPQTTLIISEKVRPLNDSDEKDSVSIIYSESINMDEKVRDQSVSLSNRDGSGPPTVIGQFIPNNPPNNNNDDVSSEGNFNLNNDVVSQESSETM